MPKSNYHKSGLVAAALGFFAASPALADAPLTAGQPQEDGAGDAEPTPETMSAPQLSPEQQAEVGTWPADKQTAYMSWPAETQGYYWELSKPRQTMFWMLADKDKVALTAMTGPEREAAWNQIEARASSSPS